MPASFQSDAEAPALDRGLALLEWLAEVPEPVRFNEVAAALALNPASTARLLRTLMGRGYVSQAADGTYRVGERAGAWGRAASWLRLRQEAEPVLASLVEATGNTALAFGYSGSHVQSLAKCVHPDAPAMQPVGHVSDQWLGGPWGWIALAAMDEAAREAWVRRTGADPAVTADRVWRVRRGLDPEVPCAGREAGRPPAAGYVLDDRLVIRHVRRMAAPLYGARGELAGMLGLGGTVHTMPKRRIAALGRRLAEHAKTLSVAIGMSRPFALSPAPPA